jgi:hypothetical protein
MTGRQKHLNNLIHLYKLLQRRSNFFHWGTNSLQLFERFDKILISNLFFFTVNLHSVSHGVLNVVPRARILVKSQHEFYLEATSSGPGYFLCKTS